MLRRVYDVILPAYIYASCLGLLVIASDRLAGHRQHGSGDQNYSGLWPLTSNETAKRIEPIDPTPAKPTPKMVHSNTAAVHAGASLIKWPPPPKAVHSNTAAVHAGASLIKWPPPPKMVHSNTAAVHAGASLIKWPPPPKVVHSNTAAVHAGASLIKWPPPPKAVHSNTAAVHAGASMIEWPPSPQAKAAEPRQPRPSKPARSTVAEVGTGAVPRPPLPTAKPKIAPSAMVANGSTGAVAREDEAKRSKASNRINKKPVEQAVVTKQRKAAPAKERRQVRMATASLPSVKVESRRMRVSNGDEVRRAVGQLNEEDRRAFRSRCGQILSAPGKFARAHVEICSAASL
jgi:hypothetical protein